jgi:hypothetical protein
MALRNGVIQVSANYVTLAVATTGERVGPPQAPVADIEEMICGQVVSG